MTQSCTRRGDARSAAVNATGVAGAGSHGADIESLRKQLDEAMPAWLAAAGRPAVLREVCRAWEEDRQWQQQRARESVHSSLSSTLVEALQAGDAGDDEEEEEEEEDEGAAAVAQALQQELEESGYLSSVRAATTTP